MSVRNNQNRSFESLQNTANTLQIIQNHAQYKKSFNMLDTHCTLNQQNQMGHQEIAKNRISSFKKIKQGYLNQKNNEGKVISKTIHNQQKSNKLSIIERLDDALTIYSHDSPRSTHTQRFLLDQSIIVMNTHDIDQIQILTPKIKLYSPLQAAFFKRRNVRTQPSSQIFQHKNNKNKQILLNIKNNPSLAIIPEINMLVYYQLTNFQQKKYLKILNANCKGILKLYHVTKFTNLNKNQSKIKIPQNSLKSLNHQKQDITLALYEPYNQSFTQFLLRSQSIQYRRFLQWVIQIVQTLKQLFKLKIYPQIDPNSLVMVNQNIKILVKPTKIDQNQRQVFKNLGLYLSAHIKMLTQSSNPESTPRNNKIKGLILFNRIFLRQFFDLLIKSQEVNIEKIQKKLYEMYQKC